MFTSRLHCLNRFQKIKSLSISSKLFHSSLCQSRKLHTTTFHKIYTSVPHQQIHEDTSNNEIEAFVANKEYGIEPRHLAQIRAKQIRSPYKNRAKILVWREEDVKNYALEMYKSEEAMQRAIRRKMKIRMAQAEKLKDKQDRDTEGSLKNVIFHSEADIILDEVVSEYGKLKKLRDSEKNKMKQVDLNNYIENGGVIPDAVVFDNRAPQVGTHQVSLLDNLSEFTRTTQNKKNLKDDESFKVTMTATGCNAFLAVWKGIVFYQTGSFTMLSETYHSLADTMMQAGMAYSNYYAQKKTASTEHPYGYKQAPQIASLGAGICIFFTGAMNSIKDGVEVCWNSIGKDAVSEIGGHGVSEMFTVSFFNPFAVLGVSLFLEGFSLYTATAAIWSKAKENEVSFRTQLNSQDDPTTTVVFYEDVAAVGGIAVAAGAMGMLAYTGNPIFDGIGSILVGGVLMRIAVSLTMKGASELLGRSIPETERQEIKDNLENDQVVRGVYDLKVTYVGPQRQRMKAEVDFDGRAVGRNYLKGKDLTILQEEMKRASETKEGTKEFLMGHSEGSIDKLGNEIDRIEKGLKKKHPHLRHIDLELN